MDDGTFTDDGGEVVPAGAIHERQAKVLGLPLAINTYGPILDMFGVTRFFQGRSASAITSVSAVESAASPAYSSAVLGTMLSLY